MRHSRVKQIMIRGVFVAVALSSLGLAACGSSGGSTSKALKLGTELPVSGTDAAVGLPTQYGVDLAVQQNKDLGNGYTLDVSHKNDVGTSGPDGSIGAANIQQLISDASVMAIVGPFNSGVAKQEIPTVNKNTIVAISPTNTNPGLTNKSSPKRMVSTSTSCTRRANPKRIFVWLAPMTFRAKWMPTSRSPRQSAPRLPLLSTTTPPMARAWRRSSPRSSPAKVARLSAAPRSRQIR